jgi:aminoglycoside 3-N-acetyltransferase
LAKQFSNKGIPMRNKATLVNELNATNIGLSGSLLIHSSMKSLGQIDGGAETVIDALV